MKYWLLIFCATCWMFSMPIWAQEWTVPRILLLTGSIVTLAMDPIAAAVSFQSKYELSNVEHEPRRGNMEGSTGANGVAALFSALSMASIISPKMHHAAPFLFGMALTSQAAATALTASTWGTDRHRPPAPIHGTYPYFDAAFGLGISSLLIHFASFLGANWWNTLVQQAVSKTSDPA